MALCDGERKRIWEGEALPPLPPEQLAMARTAPTEALRKLGRDENDSIRRAVASNPSAPPDTLKKLSCDGAELVREGVAENENTPGTVLTVLADDGSEQVRSFAASNTATPPNAFAKLSVEFGSEVAKNRSAPPDVLDRLGRSTDRHIRATVVSNPASPSAIPAGSHKVRSEHGCGGTQFCKLWIYDANGNLLAQQSDHDCDGTPEGCQNAWTYDADGRRQVQQRGDLDGFADPSPGEKRGARSHLRRHG